MNAVAPHFPPAVRVWLGLLAAATLSLTATADEALTIATYNVENYVAADRMTEDGFRRDYPKPEVQKRALREVIVAVDADLLVLQEMGGEPYLEELRRDLQAAGADYPHRALLEAADSDRHLAVLSRRPFTAVVRHAALPFTYLGAAAKVKRGLLEVRLATAAGELTVYGLHLKSRHTDRADDPQSELRRVGEAVAIRDLILRRPIAARAAGWVILGDFNDDKASKAMQRLLRRGETTIAWLLPAADARGDTWTYRYRRADSYTRVDHILLSEPLRASVRGGRGRIYDGPGSGEASDHRLVAVTLDLPEKK